MSGWLTYLLFNQLFGEVLSLPDSKARRIWGIIDELATLPKLPRLAECLVASRSKGFRFMVGIQNFSSMREIYGADVAVTLYSQFATKVIARVNDSDTASKLVNDFGGDRRVKRATIKMVDRLDEKGRRFSSWDVDWRESVEPTILSSDIMQLPDPTEIKAVPAWLQIAGLPLVRLEWQFLNIKQTAPRDVLTSSSVRIRANDAKLNEVMEPESEPTSADFEDLDMVEPDDFDLDDGDI